MRTYPSRDGHPMLVASFDKLGRLYRNRVGMSPTPNARLLGVRIARRIVANQTMVALTVLAVAGHVPGMVVPWSIAEERAIVGACAYANRQWLAGLDPAAFGVATEAVKERRRLAFVAMAETCGERVALPILRRPAPGLNVEIGKPLDRCRLRTPPEWGDFDPRGARWLGSGGDPLVLGVCSRARCPRMKGRS